MSLRFKVDFGDGDGLINLPIEEIAKVYEIGDGDIDAFVSIDNREERKEALIKYFEKVIKDLREV